MVLSAHSTARDPNPSTSMYVGGMPFSVHGIPELTSMTEVNPSVNFGRIAAGTSNSLNDVSKKSVLENWR